MCVVGAGRPGGATTVATPSEVDDRLILANGEDAWSSDRMVRRLALLLAASSLVLLAACGSDGDGEASADTTTSAVDDTTVDTSSGAASEAEFVAAANEICATINEQIDSTLGGLFLANEEPPIEDQQAGIDAIVDGTRQQADQIEALDVPADMQDDVAAMLASVRSAADEVEAAGPDFFGSSENPYADAGQQAIALGLTECNGSE